ncbi:hypothetical protein [Dehalobacter sp. MCB1]|nr:hypothetical protein [Dehalobacter sp. MCB1]
MKQIKADHKAKILAKKETIWNRILDRLEKKGKVKNKDKVLKALMK